MINPKYDLNNYIKYPVIPVLSGNQKVNTLFRSYLLLIKWSYVDTRKLVDTNAILRVSTSTPLGQLEPKDYNLKIFNHKNIYLQFLNIPEGDLDYRLEVFQSNEFKSLLEIWEYKPPINYLSLSNMPAYPLDSASGDSTVIAAINAQTNAQLATTTAINALPVTIANATNKPVTSTNSSSVTINSTGVTTVVAKADNTKGIQIVNTGAQNVKFWIQDAALATIPVYATDVTFEMELKPNSVWEIPVGLQNSGIYAMAKTATSTISVTVSSIA